MKPFGIIPPRVPLVDKAGSVAREWWRWFNAIQDVTNGGVDGSIGDAAIQAELQPPHGNDFDMAIADLRKRLETLPRGSDQRVAVKVDDLQALILGLPRPQEPLPSLDPLLALRSTARSTWNGPYIGSIGTGLTVTAGVLSGSSGMAPLVTGEADPETGSPVLIGDPDNQCVMVPL